MATFQTITTGKKQYLPLLLLADPCEAMIDRYLEAGEMHVIKAGNAAVCEAVVLPLSETACELKNIATDPQFQGQGHATRLMETLFKVRYWDYSHKKFNFQGQICLESSLAWGFLTILMTRMIHKPIEAFALWLPSSVLTGVTMVVTVIFAADFALSFKAALDLRDVLVRMEQAKDELEKMQRRLDVILAVSEENWENRKKEWNQSVESTRAGFVQRRDELVSGIEKRFERAKELLPSGRLNVNREELFDLRSKFGVNLQRPELASFLKDFTKRDMLRGNPSMVSKKFSEALEELKKSAVEYKKREKK